METLTAMDRCDRCSSAALTAYGKNGDVQIMFCNHHSNKYSDGLLLQGFDLIIDNRSVLEMSGVGKPADVPHV